VATISPGDAEVALRTFPRRWRSLLGGLDPSDPDVDAILRHRGTSGASALDAVARAAVALDDGARHLHDAVHHDRPVLDPGGGAGPSSLPEALSAIDAAAPRLAGAVRAVAAGDLDRQAELGGATVTVRTLIADVVDEVARLLRDAQQALSEARRR
jgi:hypothetical protein